MANGLTCKLLLIVSFILLLSVIICDDKRKRNNRQQTVDYSKQHQKHKIIQDDRTENLTNQNDLTIIESSGSTSDTPNSLLVPADSYSEDVNSQSESDSSFKDNMSKKEKSMNDALQSFINKKCPIHLHHDQPNYAIHSYWNHNYLMAYLCANEFITHIKENSSFKMKTNHKVSLLQAILHSIHQMGSINGIPFSALSSYLNINLDFEYSLPKLATSSSSFLKGVIWEVLGPLPVSKLEVDGDPTFQHLYNNHQHHNNNDDHNNNDNYYNSNHQFTDVIEHMLAMSTQTSISSEHVHQGEIHWTPLRSTGSNNINEVVFPDVQWNALYQSLATASVIEFQGWVRTSTFVNKNGMYLLHCIGVHSVYIRNDNMTRLLIGDIYRNPESLVTVAVELKAGVVGVIAPIRGVAQMSFGCTLNHAIPVTDESGRSDNDDNNNEKMSDKNNNHHHSSKHKSINPNNNNINNNNNYNSKQTLLVSTPHNVPNLLILNEQASQMYTSTHLLHNTQQHQKKGSADDRNSSGGSTSSSSSSSSSNIKNVDTSSSAIVSQKLLKSSGLLLSRVFSVTLQNLDSRSLTIEVQLESSPYSVVDVISSSSSSSSGSSSRRRSNNSSSNNSYYGNSKLSVRQAIPLRYSNSNRDSHDEDNGNGKTNSNGNTSGNNLNRRKYKSQHEISNIPIIIAPGQTLSLSLELHNSNNNNIDDYTTVFLPCRHSSTTPTGTSTTALTQEFALIFSPSRGAKVRTFLNLNCRKMSESFLVSFLDHDHSIAQVGVIFPLVIGGGDDNVGSSSNNNQNHNHGATTRKTAVTSPSSKKSKHQRHHQQQQSSSNTKDSTCTTSIGNESGGDDICVNTNATINTMKLPQYYYPYILSLHGTGLTATSQADAYKVMHAGDNQYTFGVRGFFVLAPSRPGAHNWEHVGDLSARYALSSMQKILSPYSLFLPQISGSDNNNDDDDDEEEEKNIFHGGTHHDGGSKANGSGGIISGHSMGGHGAWIMATNSPDLAVCVSPAAGWIRKEDYGNSNAFFELDIQNTYISSKLKHILEMAMSEYHVDKIIESNLNMMYKVYIRVGSLDVSTHPWYSRRMFRLLKNQEVNVTLEEVEGKEHWWWDSDKANDGGALNDRTMRQFYESCRLRFEQEIDAVAALTSDTNNTAATTILKSFSSSSSTAASELATTATAATIVLTKEQKTLHIPRCRQDVLRLRAVNIGMQQGVCGIHILQQYRYMSESVVDMYCHTINTNTLSTDDFHTAITSSSSSSSSSSSFTLESWNRFVQLKRTWSEQESHDMNDRLRILRVKEYSLCEIHTVNVRRLNLRAKYMLRVFDNNALVLIDGIKIDIGRNYNNINTSTTSNTKTTMKNNNKNTEYDKRSVVRIINNKSVTNINSAVHICWNDNDDDDDEDDEQYPRICYSNKHHIQNTINDYPHSDFTSSQSQQQEQQHRVQQHEQQQQHQQQEELSHFTLPHLQRLPITAGPIRHVYTRPFYIVYGTSSTKKTRLILQDIAVYLANRHYISHGTQVRVLSDIEYRGNYQLFIQKEIQLKNIIFVGGVDDNKIMKKYCSHYPQKRDSTKKKKKKNYDANNHHHHHHETDGVVDNNDDSNIQGDTNVMSTKEDLHCNTPVEFLYPSSSSSSSVYSDTNSIGFRIGAYSFLHNEDDAAVLYTLPLYRHHHNNNNNNRNHGTTTATTVSNNNIAYAMCLHASTVEGYMSLARLAWPVVPPMVRSPFSNYMPDYLVLTQPHSSQSGSGSGSGTTAHHIPSSGMSVWSHGFGAVAMAGYWNSTWGFDPENAFIHPRLMKHHKKKKRKRS